MAINSSLMVLGRCLEALKMNQCAPPGAQPRIIPFRGARLMLASCGLGHM